MKRKLLSVLMALCLILTLLPTAVFAEELTPPEESGEQQEEQIKEPSTPEKEPDDPEKEHEGEEDLQPSDAQILPALIALKMFGSVIKIRLGPLSGWTLNAKQAGKIINPAINATNVSRTVTQTASPVRVLSFPI